MPNVFTAHSNLDMTTAGRIWDTWNTGTSSSTSMVPWNTWVVEWQDINETTTNEHGQTLYRHSYRIVNNENLTAEQYRLAQEQLYARHNELWGVWVGGATNSVWNEWVAGTTGIGDSLVTARRAQQPAEVAQQVDRREAEIKADAILKSWLTEEQIKEYETTKAVTVKIDNVRSLRFRKGRVSNIEELENGKVKARLCVHVQDNVPDADNMLAQMLFASVDLEGFYAMANRRRV